MPRVELDIRAQVAQLSKGLKSTQAQLTQLQKKSDQTNKSMQSGFNKSSASLQKFAGYFGIAFGGAMVLRGLNKQIDLMKEFEKTMANVFTLLSDAQKKKYAQFLPAGSAKIIGDYGLAVQDVNKALFDTISAGIDAGDSIMFLDEAAKLAIGGVTDLSTAVDGMTSVMNAYSLSIEDANKVASAFFTAQKYGKTTVAELAQNIGMVAPVAKMAGVSFQEVLSALALLTKQGIQTDIATTALRATLVALTSPTKTSANEFKKLGIETGITAIQEVGLAETLLKVAQATKINKDKMTELIPNVRALVAVAALGEEALKEYDIILKDVETDTGEASSLSAALETQMNTLEFQVNKTKGAYQEYVLTLNSSEAKEAYKTALEFIRETISLSSKLVNEKWFQKIAEHALTFGWSTSKAFWEAVSSLNPYDIALQRIVKRFEDIDPLLLSGIKSFETLGETVELLWRDYNKLGGIEKKEIETLGNLYKKVKELNEQKRELAITDKKGIKDINDQIIALKKLIKELETLSTAIKPEGIEPYVFQLLPESDVLIDEREEYYELLREMNEDIIDIEEEKQKKLKEIRKKYRDEDLEAEKLKEEYALRSLSLISGFAGTLSDMNQIRMNRELIAAKDNEKKKEAIAREYAKKEQRNAILRATISGAEALVKNWGQWGTTVGSILNILQIALTAAQIGVIASQKFAKGGYDVLKGRRHDQGGVQIPIGEAEEGEGHAVFSRKATRKFKNVLPELVKSINQGSFPVIDLGTTERIGKKEDIMRHMVSLDESKQLEAIRQLLAERKTNVYYENGYRIEESKGLIRRIKLK